MLAHFDTKNIHKGKKKSQEKEDKGRRTCEEEFGRPHCEQTRITNAVASSAAKPRDGVRHAICVPIARVIL